MEEWGHTESAEINILFRAFATVFLFHCVKPSSFFPFFFFPVNGETRPRHGDLWLGPAGVFSVLCSSCPHLLSTPPTPPPTPPFLLLLLPLLLLLFLLSFEIAPRDGCAPETQGRAQARHLSSSQWWMAGGRVCVVLFSLCSLIRMMFWPCFGKCVFDCVSVLVCNF